MKTKTNREKKKEESLKSILGIFESAMSLVFKRPLTDEEVKNIIQNLFFYTQQNESDGEHN